MQEKTGGTEMEKTKKKCMPQLRSKRIKVQRVVVGIAEMPVGGKMFIIAGIVTNINVMNQNKIFMF